MEFFFTGVITVFLVHPKSPFDFPYVLHCRGVPRYYSTEEMTKLWSTWLARLMCLIILSWATVSCHVRVTRFKRSHGKCYFRKVRRNISTFNDMLISAYIMESGARVSFHAYYFKQEQLTKHFNHG